MKHCNCDGEGLRDPVSDPDHCVECCREASEKDAAKLDALKAENAKLLLQVNESRNINHDLADVLRCLEWNNEGWCPWCMGKRPNHDGPCKLQIMIAKGYIPNKPKTEKRVEEGQKCEGCQQVKPDVLPYCHECYMMT